MHLSSRCYCDVIQRYRCILLYLSYSIYSFVISEWMAFCCYISVFHLNSCRLNRRSNARIAQPTLMHKNVRNVTNFHCSSAQPEVLPSCGNKFVSPSVEKSCRSIVYFPLAFSQIKRWCEFLSILFLLTFRYKWFILLWVEVCEKLSLFVFHFLLSLLFNGSSSIVLGALLQPGGVTGHRNTKAEALRS
jgi:hypothetical protein